MRTEPLTKQYYEEQNKLWNEMVSRNKVDNASVLTNKQKYGTNRLSIEASAVLAINIAKLILA